MTIKDKRILITAGPTWVPIDSVRVISNLATGETGILLAEKFTRLGAKVTLLLGPTGACCLNKKIRLVRFKFFEDLRRLLIKELKNKKYSLVIHSAAVSDYSPVKRYPRKIKSGVKHLRIDLLPTPKIIDGIKKIENNLKLVGFKFEPGAPRNILIKKGRQLLRRSHVDLVVANSIFQNQYRAYIIAPDKIDGPLPNKRLLVSALIQRLRRDL